jgi:hypothetical protein
MKSEPQNIYDHPDFFAGYQALRQNDTGLTGVLVEATPLTSDSTIRDPVAKALALQTELWRPPFLLRAVRRP